jgi:hypothetical protein
VSPVAGRDPVQRDYLFRTFLAGRKRSENYVINRLWHRLDDLDLKPVAQQYVDRGDGTHALLDLYFPQLNIGIECDEAQHLATEDADLARTVAITNGITMDQKVGAIRAADILRVERVRATDDVRAIHTRIDEIVRLLRQRKALSTGFQPWDPTLTDTGRVLARGQIDAADNYFFPGTQDIRPLFGLSAVTVQRALYRVAPGVPTRLWCIRLVDKAGSSTASNGVENRTSADWTEIYEREVPARAVITAHAQRLDRIVFARSRNALGDSGYRFLGVFSVTGETTRLDDGAPFFVHRRKSGSLDLRQYLGRINPPPQSKDATFPPSTTSVPREDTNEHLG